MQKNLYIVVKDTAPNFKRQNITYNLGLLQLSKTTTVKFGLLKSSASGTLLKIKASWSFKDIQAFS